MRMTRLLAVLAACWIAPVLAGSLPVELVNRTDIAAHIGANNSALGPSSVSTNGRFVVFSSTASNLVESDNNGVADLFLHDLDTGIIERVNLANDGSEADVSTFSRAGVSDDGRYVVFSTSATLTAEPTSGNSQIYRRDRVAGTTQLLSRDGNGAPSNVSSTAGNISADGRYSVFSSNAAIGAPPSGYPQVYRHDAVSNTLELVSATPANTAPNFGPSWEPQISDDGRYVLFVSYSAELVAGDTNARVDLFLRDMQLGVTQRVSVSSSGGQLAEPSAVVSEFSLHCSVARISNNGRYVVFATAAAADPADTNGAPDIYRFDRVAGTTQRISDGVGTVAPNSYNVCPTISANGERIAWWSQARDAQNTSALYLRDLGAGTLRPLLTHAEPSTFFSGFTLALPGDGSGLFFASNLLMPGSRYSHIYRFDTDSDLLARLSESPDSSFGPFANDHSNDTMQSVGVGGASASADGRYVVFASAANNLVVADTNGVPDIFLRDRLTATTQRISQRSDGSQSDCLSSAPSIDPEGRYIVFTSCGALAAPAAGTQREAYRYDRITGGIALVSVGTAGQRTNGDSLHPHLSDDGRIVGFASCATDLLATATTSCQVFARDMLAGTTQLISRTAAGQPGNASGGGVRVAGSGQYVLFGSSATDLVAGDTNNRFDVFSHDRVSQITQRLSIASDGTQGNSEAFLGNASSNGRRAVFTSSATNLVAGATTVRSRVYLRDLDTLTTSLIAVPGDNDKAGSWPSLSADGTRVVFVNSGANSGISSFNDSSRQKLYLFDQPSGSYRPLTWFERDTPFSLTNSPRFTADGTRIVFDSNRDDLVKDDGNGAFTDVFLLYLADSIFADGFEAPAR